MGRWTESWEKTQPLDPRTAASIRNSFSNTPEITVLVDLPHLFIVQDKDNELFFMWKVS